MARQEIARIKKSEKRENREIERERKRKRTI
jgi:hypothetical protein